MSSADPADVNTTTRGRKSQLSTLEISELDRACYPIFEAFGEFPYLVGSSTRKRGFRDVDVRLILPDDVFDRLFGDEEPAAHGGKALWALLSMLGSVYLREKTGLPVDFQVQRQSEANEKFKTADGHTRNPLGVRGLLWYAGGGDAAPTRDRNPKVSA